MAADTVTLALQGDVSLKQFAEAVAHFHGLVVALSDEAKVTGVEWRVEDLAYSSTIATARAVPLNGMSAAVPERVEHVVKSYAEVGRNLQTGTKLPFRRTARTHAEKLASLAGNGVKQVRFETIFADAVIEAYLPERALKPLQLVEAYGAVTGRVQTLMSRSELRFTLYDRFHDRAVSCYLEESSRMIMREMWDRLATVEGRVTRDPASGRPLSVRHITKVTPIPEVPAQDYLETRSAVPSRERSEDVIRRLRDAW